MKRVFLGVLACLLSVAAAAGADKKSFGEKLAGAREVAIADVLKSPESYEGKVVRVRGTVKDVCRKMGCWMEIAGADGAVIQIKVDDGVIVFPVDAIGRTAVAEGRVEIRDLTREQYLEWRQHVAEEQGAEFDPAGIGDPPYRLIRIRGLGAEIEG